MNEKLLKKVDLGKEGEKKVTSVPVDTIKSNTNKIARALNKLVPEAEQLLFSAEVSSSEKEEIITELTKFVGYLNGMSTEVGRLSFFGEKVR